MPDWQRLIREHLRDFELDAPRAEEIVTEFAGHLEDVFSELRRRGLAEEDAFRRALDEIPNWKKFRRRLRRAALQEDTMSKQAKCLWIPGLFMLALFLAASVGVFRAEMFPEGVDVDNSAVSFLIYIPWLAALPAIGALGTYWSRRMGGSVAARIGVCLFPATVLIAIFLAVAAPDVARVIWDPRLHFMASRVLRYRAFCALHWLVYPCVGLLLGALPFLSGKASQHFRSAALDS